MAKTLASTMELQYKLMQIERMVASKIFGNDAHKAMSFLTLMLWLLFKSCSKLRSSQMGNNGEFEDGI